MTASLSVSVIVPAYQAADMLADVLRALLAARAEGMVTELIVVDDGSDDGTAEVAARFADRVVRREVRAGPARARNAGAALATMEWLFFLDADILVHPDLFRQLRTAIAAHPEAGAIFGTYDAIPPAPGLVSRYRNLLHRYVHLSGVGPAETFWGGLGAVRTDLFRSLGGFNPNRYPRPQIEDIEFGYRLRDRGVLILLDPAIQGTHLKSWPLWRLIRADFRDRAIPWMRLLLERRGRVRPTLNVREGEQLRVAAAGAVIALVGTGLVVGDRRFALVAGGLLGAVALSNAPLYRWFHREGGLRFALGAMLLHLGYYLTNAVAAAVGTMAHLVDRIYPSSASPPEGELAMAGSIESPELRAAFAPLHKRAFGVATGTAAGLVTFLMTAVYLIRNPQPGFDLGLLRHFLAGYSVTWLGAVLGAAQAFVAGFVMGWFLAFARNLSLAAMLFAVRSRVELDQTRDFLDHI